MTGEIKKDKYVYDRRVGIRALGGNAYIREERPAELLGDVMPPFRTPTRSPRLQPHSAPPTSASKSSV